MYDKIEEWYLTAHLHPPVAHTKPFYLVSN